MRHGASCNTSQLSRKNRICYLFATTSADASDAEHNEIWPRGRTNHYWFDLNRDWLLGIHPESRGKLNWYHQWYPNVVTDFHEMGTNSSYFFEPMKVNASKDPIMPKENYTTLNETFGNYHKGREEKPHELKHDIKLDRTNQCKVGFINVLDEKNDLNLDIGVEILDKLY